MLQIEKIGNTDTYRNKVNIDIHIRNSYGIIDYFSLDLGRVKVFFQEFITIIDPKII